MISRSKPTARGHFHSRMAPSSPPLHYSHTSSEENNKVFGRAQSFVPGAPTNVQFMVKDSKKYASTSGWGFAQFKDGKPDGTADLKTCFPCHQPVKDRDFVFTKYAPTP